jgi:hypothetical protein
MTRAERLRAAGLCIQCGKAGPAPRRTCCAPCLAYKARLQRDREALRRNLPFAWRGITREARPLTESEVGRTGPRDRVTLKVGEREFHAIGTIADRRRISIRRAFELVLGDLDALRLGA